MHESSKPLLEVLWQSLLMVRPSRMSMFCQSWHRSFYPFWYCSLPQASCRLRMSTAGSLSPLQLTGEPSWRLPAISDQPSIRIDITSIHSVRPGQSKFVLRDGNEVRAGDLVQSEPSQRPQIGQRLLHQESRKQGIGHNHLVPPS